LSQDAPQDALDTPSTPDASPDPAGVDAATASSTPEKGHEAVAWWVPTWYVLFCALPLAGAFFLPVPLMMVMRSYRPPVDFITAAWVGVLTGWVQWGFALVAWLVAGWLFTGEESAADAGSASWWRRTTQMWIVLVLAWGLISTVGIWVFYAVVGHALGLDTIN
jgi:hypothetical protein